MGNKQNEHSRRLGIGTVQFGTEYGISNTVGRPSMSEVAQILELAADHGSTVLDTAPMYGDAEQVLGSTLPLRHSFQIVTKTAQFRKDKILGADVDLLERTFHISLLKLRQTSVYGLLAHHAGDLLVSGGELLYARMAEFKRQRMVKKIGASVYSADQIDALLERYQIDLIQVPVNLLDQRLIDSGHLARLKSRGVEIHSRSAFLQGLLLIPPDHLPDYFDPVRGLLSAYNAWLYQHQMSPVEGALAFVNGQADIDCVVVGVCATSELTEIASIWDRLSEQAVDMADFRCGDEQYVNPSMWRVGR
jgi:aryl-alcohol dehydrogenase-like predicted oxidoreductase